MSRPPVRSFVLAVAALAACGEVKPTIVDAPPAVDAPVDAVVIDGPDIDAPPGAVTLTVVRGGAATGTVSSVPAGIDCGTTCTAQYPMGTVVTLTAAPGAGATFTGWSGGGCAGTGSCAVALNADTAISADFAVAQYAVTVAVSGNGTGTVSSAPAGIACPGACTTMVAHGSAITLTAAPAGGSTFLGWSGGACTGTGPCALTVTAPATINASFALNNSLVVTRTGNGTGTVTSSPAGINCGTDCAEAYGVGALVTLTAAASAGSTFTGWSGSGCAGTGPCVVTMDMSRMVSAAFTLNQYVVTVTKAGTGTGTVTSNPAGINCGIDCNETVNHGSMTMLTAVPDASSTFAGWSGGCTGTGTCTITATAATTVTATFTLRQFTLTVARAGTGVGSVSSSPAGITCGTDCAQDYTSGTTVTLTAAVVAGSGSAFGGWSGGGCSGTGTCVTTVTAASTVTATFTLTGPGGALSFDGTNDLATLVSSTRFDSSFATVEAWVNITAVTGAAVSLWGPGGGPDKYMLQFMGAAAPGWSARIVRTGIPGQSTASSTLTTGAWVHIAMVYDGTNLILYRNGVQVTTTPLPGTLSAATGPLVLGVEEIGLGSPSFMRGQLDEVRIWNVARTATQVSASYNRLISTASSGLVAYYRFDEVTGQTVLDSTASALHGNLGASAAAAADDPARVASGAPVTP